jgi:putative FmdB family regulatory protein
MAIYNYCCKVCNSKFSIVVGILDKTPDNMIECPKCKSSSQVKRIWDKFSFVLKGKDFYATDHKGK